MSPPTKKKKKKKKNHRVCVVGCFSIRFNHDISSFSSIFIVIPTAALVFLEFGSCCQVCCLSPHSLFLACGKTSPSTLLTPLPLLLHIYFFIFEMSHFYALILFVFFRYLFRSCQMPKFVAFHKQCRFFFLKT